MTWSMRSEDIIQCAGNLERFCGLTATSDKAERRCRTAARVDNSDLAVSAGVEPGCTVGRGTLADVVCAFVRCDCLAIGSGAHRRMRLDDLCHRSSDGSARRRHVFGAASFCSTPPDCIVVTDNGRVSNFSFGVPTLANGNASW